MGGTHKIFADIDVDGEVKGTSLDLNGNAQIDGTITVGQDDTGYDVKFFLAASGRYIMIDEDDNSLLFTDNANAKFGNGGDLQLSHDGTDSRIDNMVGHLKIRNYADDSDIIFETDNGSGGTTQYFRIDGGAKQTRVSEQFNFLDSVKTTYGTGGDLVLFHDGSNSYLENKVGNLILRQEANDADLILKCDDGSGGDTAYITLDGSATRTVFNESAQFVDSKYLYFGTGADAHIRHDGSNYTISNSEGTITIDNAANDKDIIFKGTDNSGDITALTLDMSDAGAAYFNQWIYTASGGIGRDAHNTIDFSTDNQITVKTNNTTALTINSSQLATFAGDITVGDDMFVADGGIINLGSDNDLNIQHDGADAIINNNTGHLYFTNYADDRDIYFRSDDGSGGVAEYFRLDGSIAGGDGAGTVFTIWPDNSRIGLGANADLRMYHDGSDSQVINLTGNLIFDQRVDDSDIIFKSDNGSGGTAEYLRFDGGITSIVTSKDLLIATDGTNGNLKLGAGQDLVLNHDGTDSKITNATGDLYIDNGANDKDIIFQSDDGSGGLGEYFRLDGSQSDASSDYRYTRWQDYSVITLGNGNDLQLWHDATDGRIGNYTGDLKITQEVNDKDIILSCDDGSGGVTAYITLDGSQEAVVFGKAPQIPQYITHVGDGNTYFGFADNDVFRVGVGGTTRLNIGSGIELTGNTTLTGTLNVTGNATLVGIIMDGNTITGVDDSGEFTNDDAHIMTSAAIEDKILGYGYSTTTGTVTGTGAANRIAYFANSSMIQSNAGFTFDGTDFTAPGAITGASLDINGNADISGNLTGLDNVTSTNFIIGGHTINDIDVTSEDSNADDHLMTAKAIVNLIADNENSFLTSSGNTSGTAAIATTITVADESSDTSCNVLFTTAATGNLGPKSGTNLTFNSSSGVLTATGFAGALTGNVTGNASGSSGSCTGNAATATTAALATAVTVTANNSESANLFPVFVDGASGTQGLETDSGYTYNPSSGVLKAQKLSTDVAEIVENNKDGGALMTLTGQGAGNEANICLKMIGTQDGNPIKMKMVALNDNSSQVGAGILSYDAEDDSFGIGQNSSHNRMAIKMENTITSPVDGSTYVYYEPTSIKAREYIITANNTHYDFYGDIMRNGNDTTVRGKMYCFKNGTWTITNADTKLDANGLLGIALGTNSTTHGMLLKGTFTLDYDPGGIGNPLYISTTDGLVSTTVPSTSGHIVRLVGYLVGGAHGNLWFNPDSTYVEVA